MATQVKLQSRKGCYLSHLIATHDFGMIYETHGNEGKASAYTLPQACTAFWSHYNSQRAGVGLVVSNAFLARFAPVRETDWIQIEQGRLACLRLQGPEGKLDLWTAYLPTGDTPQKDKTARDNTRRLLSSHLSPTCSTLSIVVGDWNYVVHCKDRWCHAQQNWTGHSNTKEAEEADELVFHPADLHELYQENHTHFSTIASSRIDRVYTNHHLSEQLDHRFGCTTLPRQSQLSTHAAISFSRTKPSTHTPGTEHSTPTLTHTTINHPDWPKRVAAELQSISITPDDYNNPIRRLVLAKRAMHNVSNNMIHDHVFAEATTNDEKLNCTLSFIRAAQDINLAKMYRKCLEYPHIGAHVNPRDPNVCYTQGFRDLQDHATHLARQHLTDELQDAQRQVKENSSDFRSSTRKNNVLSQLKKLQPGSCNSIGAIDEGDGNFTTDPEMIAKRLATHWGNTFRHMPINHHMLQQWLTSLPQLSPRPHASTTATATPTQLDNATTQTTSTPAHTALPHTTVPQRSQSCTTSSTTTGDKTAHKQLGPLARTRPQRRPLPTHAGAWRVRRKDVETAIRHSGNSAPGPDGIPFKAWRALGALGISILYDTAACLESDEAQHLLQEAYHDCDNSCNNEVVNHNGTHHYNHSILVCLPKKSTSITSDGTEAYTANNTRPLSIVNCDNRIVASAARNRWEHYLASWILPRQQGFLSNRSIIRNLLQLDTASMITSLTQPDGACVLLDFASAFPSISQEFLFEVLRHIGLPRNSLNLLTSLYSNSFCEVKQGNTTVPGFSLQTGVRQGCPLSPLLYATVAEIMLDKIEQQCPGTLTRCYADDTALVVNNFWDEAPILENLFREFSQISGLHLNLRKCVILPLDEGDVDTFKDRLHQHLPAWKDMCVARYGKYLGFCVGPGKGDKSWEGPTDKFRKRCKLWENQGTGLHYQNMAYNTFALSTLTYVAQLEAPPPDTLHAEIQGLRRVVKGPGQWAQPEDLWRLKEHFGQTISCKSLAHTAIAAQLRVHTWDTACRHRDYRLDTSDLRMALHSGSNRVNLLRWDSWYQRSFALTLEATKQHYTTKVGPIDDLINNANQSDRDGNTQYHNSPKQQFQRKAYDRLLKSERYLPTHHTREKLQRWKLHDAGKNPLPANTTCRQNTPAWCSRRALASLQLLPKLVPPRVCAAVLSTQWNRWCTHRRFQKRHCSSNICLLGCSPQAEDSIEHYFRCPVTRDILHKQLHLSPHLYANIHTATLCNANITDTDCLTAVALLSYALYTTTNHLRALPAPRAINTYDMLAQNLREGAKHHNHATTVLDNRWNNQRRGDRLPPIPYTI